ncbi:MAG: hypothetical protein IKZ90_01365 [Clostridiales bacterium]|nr:hypothetical protein [Clostridiales bacterium]
MAVEISTYNYGLCLFSMPHIQAFLKEKKIRSKKVLEVMQKQKDIYLDAIGKGVWLPIVGINSGHYRVCVDGVDEVFDDEWEEIFSYDGFNLEVQDGFWLSDTGSFLKFEPEEYEGDGEEIAGSWGMVTYNSSKERWHKDMAGTLSYSDVHYDFPNGKYLVTIHGMARKVPNAERGALNYGYRFTLIETDVFTECRNPRENELYEFNTEWLKTTVSGKVCWLPKKESGIKWPVEQAELGRQIVIPMDGDGVAYLVIKFKMDDKAEEGVTHCRVKTRKWKSTDEDYMLERGKKYSICEMTKKRDQKIFKKLGTLTIED